MKQTKNQKEYLRKYREKNKDRIKKVIGQYYLKNKESISQYMKEYGTKHREYLTKKQNECRTKKLYNVDDKLYDEILKKQNYKCAICLSDKNTNKKTRFDIDHCHTTKNVRGLLCNRCNRGLGFFKDNISILENAIKYLNNNN